MSFAFWLPIWRHWAILNFPFVYPGSCNTHEWESWWCLFTHSSRLRHGIQTIQHAVYSSFKLPYLYSVNVGKSKQLLFGRWAFCAGYLYCKGTSGSIFRGWRISVTRSQVISHYDAGVHRNKAAGARTLFHIMSMHDSLLFTHSKSFVIPLNASSLALPRYDGSIMHMTKLPFHLLVCSRIHSLLRSIIVSCVNYLSINPSHNVRRDTWVIHTSLRQMTPLSRWHAFGLTLLYMNIAE